MAAGKATYAEIYEYVLANYGIKVGGNEIAEAKEKAGLRPRKAHNRLDPGTRSTYSPPESIAAIHAALRHFGVIR